MFPAMPRPKSDIIRIQSGLRLRPEIIKAMKHLALDLEQPLNVLVETASEEFLQRHGHTIPHPQQEPKAARPLPQSSKARVKG